MTPYSSLSRAATDLLSVSIDLPILDISCKWNHTIYGLSWLASFLDLSMLYHVWVLHSFLVLNSIPLYVYVYHSLFIHLSVDGNLGCFYLLAIVNASMNIGIKVSESLLSVLLDIHLRVELLDHMAILCLTSCGTAKLIPTAAAPFYIPTSNTQGFQILANTCYFWF